MKKVTLFGAGLGIALVSGVALASTAGWSSTAGVTITSVEIDDTGSGTSTYLTLSSTSLSHLPSCNTNSTHQYIAAGSADNVKAMTAAATAAYLAGRSVEIYFNNACTNGYPQFTLLSLE